MDPLSTDLEMEIIGYFKSKVFVVFKNRGGQLDSRQSLSQMIDIRNS